MVDDVVELVLVDEVDVLVVDVVVVPAVVVVDVDDVVVPTVDVVEVDVVVVPVVDVVVVATVDKEPTIMLSKFALASEVISCRYLPLIQVGLSVLSKSEICCPSK